MSDELARRLARVRVPDADAARARAQRVVAAAYAERPPQRRARRAGVALAAAVALGGTVGLAVTPPGHALGDWVRRLVAPPAGVPARPALDALPAAGRLLVTGPGGPWIVAGDGSRRRLGPYDDATWSPRGRFVAVARDRQLLAVDPRGGVRWAIARAERVRLPRWSPGAGFRVAYVSGKALRVTGGDGTGDHQLAAAAAAVAPAWRPGAGHTVAYATRGRRVVVADADSGRRRWRARLPAVASQLEWSRDGRRLLVVLPHEARLLDGAGRVRRRIRVPAGSVATAATLAPGGDALALVRHDPARARGAVVRIDLRRRDAPERVLLDGPGPLSGAVWSPDGRWVLAGWPAADQWLFLRARGPAGVSAFSGIAAQFDPGARGPRGFPRVEGWCCAP